MPTVQEAGDGVATDGVATHGVATDPGDAGASTGGRKVAIITLGCGRNEVDTEQLAGLFHRDGHHLVEDPADAEVVLVNTCTFIAPAKQESIDTVLAACQLKEDGVARAVLVVGCMAQRYPHELAEAIPEADAIVGFDGYPRLPAIAGQVLDGAVSERVLGVGPAHPGSRSKGSDAAGDRGGEHGADRGQDPGADAAAARFALPLLITPTAAPAAPAAPVATPAAAPASVAEPALARAPLGAAAGSAAHEVTQDDLDRMPASGPRFPVRHLGAQGDPRAWAYLKIASGCDRVCTFCAIPSFRGRFRSRPLEELVEEARWLAAQGVRELVLVSENTTSWGKDLPGGRDLQPALLEALSAVEGIERLRLMYLQPAELTEQLLAAIAELPGVASYYDLSLQHVSAPVVARMGRSGDHERFQGLVDRARALDAHAVFRSNFILGFPGETEADVAQLESFLRTARLDWVGFFAFSVEDGTPSATMPDQVPADRARERLERVTTLQEQLADRASRSFVGRDLDVLVDEVEDAGTPAERTLGRSYREAPDTDGEIELRARDGSPAAVPPGRIVTARVVDSGGVDLVAEVDAATAGGTSG